MKYYAKIKGTEVWARLLRADLDQLVKEGYKLDFASLPSGSVYVTVR